MLKNFGIREALEVLGFITIVSYIGYIPFFFIPHLGYFLFGSFLLLFAGSVLLLWRFGLFNRKLFYLRIVLITGKGLSVQKLDKSWGKEEKPAKVIDVRVSD
jgi:hypothetical protein